MASYLPDNQNKARLFAKRERELRHKLKHNAPQDKLLVAAEKLRAAKIAVFKCRFANIGENQPYNFDPHKQARNKHELRKWLAMSTDDILALYQSAQE